MHQVGFIYNITSA